MFKNKCFIFVSLVCRSKVGNSLYILVKGYTRKGACHYAMKDYTKATQAYSKALEIDKDNKVDEK